MAEPYIHPDCRSCKDRRELRAETKPWHLPWGEITGAWERLFADFPPELMHRFMEMAHADRTAAEASLMWWAAYEADQRNQKEQSG